MAPAQVWAPDRPADSVSARLKHARDHARSQKLKAPPSISFRPGYELLIPRPIKTASADTISHWYCGHKYGLSNSFLLVMVPGLFTLMPFASFFDPGGWQFSCLFPPPPPPPRHLQFSSWVLLYSPPVKSACCCHSTLCTRKPQPCTESHQNHLGSFSWIFSELHFRFGKKKRRNWHVISWYMKYCIFNFSPCPSLKGVTWARIRSAGFYLLFLIPLIPIRSGSP